MIKYGDTVTVKSLFNFDENYLKIGQVIEVQVYNYDNNCRVLFYDGTCAIYSNVHLKKIKRKIKRPKYMKEK